MASSTTNTPRIQLKDTQTGQWQDITHAVERFSISAKVAGYAARQCANAFERLGRALEGFVQVDIVATIKVLELERQERLANVWRYAVVLWFVVAIVAVWVSV